MAAINQQILTLDSQNQLRKVDKMARDWAIAHAGHYQGQARRELGGSNPFREWRRDGLTIRISKPQSAAFKQGQIVSVRYAPAGNAEPYVGYLMTYGLADAERSGGCFISITSRPDALPDDDAPWDGSAGVAGLDAIIAAVNDDRPRAAETASRTQSSDGISSIDNLFAQHDAAIVLTEEGQQGDEFRELAARHGDWASVVSIGASEQLAIGRQLLNDELYWWVRARIALFARYENSDGERLQMAESEYDKAAAFLDDARQRTRSDVVNRNCLTLLEFLESTADIQNAGMRALADVIAREPSTETSPPEIAAVASDGPENVAAQQRIYVLEDQLEEANTAIAELREQLQQLQEYATYDDDAPDEPAVANVTEGKADRHTMVLGAITEPDRYPRLRFLTNFDKPLADFGKQRPNGAEIVTALDAINKLAQAWYNTPGGSIGPWDNYFTSLKPGWTHANGESEFTMSRFGDKRSFSDQDHDRRVSITRHLTYRGSNSGLQIYFDRDDVTDNFIVGYIGAHLPYATNRS